MSNVNQERDTETSETAYQQALDYLYSFINFEHKRLDRYTASKLDPTRPQRLSEFLGSPHERFPAIHIAGTKGKGSVAAMCAAVLRAAGLKVGLYTSPHMQEFRERIRVITADDGDGRISQASFVRLMAQVEAAVAHFPDVTWFEILTAVAFLHFAQEQVDVAVVEVGLGGRLDATNVLTPLVSVITSLSLDHTQLLGETLAEIAAEKGGIIKPGVPLVTAVQAPEAHSRLLEIAGERAAPMTVIGRDWLYEGRLDLHSGKQTLIIRQSADHTFIPDDATFSLALAGEHQLENATVALAALTAVRPHFPGLDLQAAQTGLATVAWPGRLQTLFEGEELPTILVDCAHNVDSAVKLRQALSHQYLYENLWLVFGATVDKDVRGMLAELLPLARMTIATASSHPRAAGADDLARLAAELGYDIMTAPTVEAAVSSAWLLADSRDLICVTGSIFVVGDLLNQWESLQSHLPGIRTSRPPQDDRFDYLGQSRW
jgi:dihydrofolate synthase / folylpolyglutamate synthase